MAYVGEGTAGQVLTSNGPGETPTFQAAGGGGGGAWELISTATVSSPVATVDFTGLSSSYFMYMVVIQGIIPQVDIAPLRFRTSTNNGSSYDSGASDYAYFGYSNQMGGSDTSVVLDDDGAASEIILSSGTACGTGSNEQAQFIFYIINPSETDYTEILCRGGLNNFLGNIIRTDVIGKRLSAADVDAIRFYFNSGFDAGVFKLYGLSAS